MYVDQGAYAKNDKGHWYPRSNPDSLANQMPCTDLMIWLPVRKWHVRDNFVVTREGFDPIFHHVDSDRIQLILNTEERRFHSIREEGAKPVTGRFQIDVWSGDAPGEAGMIRHWPEKEGDEEALLGTITVPSEIFEALRNALLGRLASVSIGLRLKLFKENIALSFDEAWMSQDFFFPYGETVVLDQFKICIANDSDGAGPTDEEALFEPKEDASPVIIPPKQVLWQNGTTNQLTIIILLLGAIAVLMFVRGL